MIGRIWAFSLAAGVLAPGVSADNPCYPSDIYVGRCGGDLDDGTFTGTPDGGVTVDDYLYFLYLYEQGSPCADCDDGTYTGTPDGGVTIDDFLYFFCHLWCC